MRWHQTGYHTFHVMAQRYGNGPYMYRDQSSYASSQRETSLHCNDVAHWLGAHLDWSLYVSYQYLRLVGPRQAQFRESDGTRAHAGLGGSVYTSRTILFMRFWGIDLIENSNWQILKIMCLLCHNIIMYAFSRSHHEFRYWWYPGGYR